MMSGSGQEDGVLVIADLPEKVSIEFGIDCTTYETGPNFKGVGLIPTGLHFIYYSTGMGARQGFFIESRKGSIEVKIWDAQFEEISMTNSLSNESMETLLEAMNRGELNNNIGPYPYAQHQIWINLTSYVNSRVLRNANAEIGVQLYPGESQDMMELEMKTAIKRQDKKVVTDLVSYVSNSARIARFSDTKEAESRLREQINSNSVIDIKERTQELTSLHMDKSGIITHLVSTYFSDNLEDLLGELQLAFILFINLYSYPALEQWKSLIYLICTSEKLLKSNALFATGFIRVLYEQLNFAPTDFFEDELSKTNFLQPSLTALFIALNDITSDSHSAIFEHKRRLQLFVSKKFNIEENVFEQIASKNTDILSDYVQRAKIFGYKNSKTQNVNGFIQMDEDWGDDMPVIVGYQDDSMSENASSVLPVSSNHEQFWNKVDGNINVQKDVISNADLMEEIIDCEELVNEMKIESTDKANLDNMKYSWRYPLLYESMAASNFKEDCYMTAARIIDEFGYVLNNHPDQTSQMSSSNKKALESLVGEAKMFIECEITR